MRVPLLFGLAAVVGLPPDVVPEKRREDAVRGGTETILLAEDAESLRALAERILTGLGYTVLIARDGEEAVEVLPPLPWRGRYGRCWTGCEIDLLEETSRGFR